jgi:spermidine synthase
MKRYILEIAVFACGGIVMAYEITGSRMVAPYFGTSIYVWTSLIGIILASLSAGYWLGGRLSDQKPSFAVLAWIVLLAAVFIGLTTLLRAFVLQGLSWIFSDMILRTLLGAIILFAPASILLGMVSPYAVRLKLSSIETSGATVGKLYALSTLGSITGTFAAGFFLIPYLGTGNLLFTLAGILVLVSLLLHFKRNKRSNILAAALVLPALGLGAYTLSVPASGMIQTDTRYNHVQIFDMDYWIGGEPIKVMKVNDEYSSAMFLHRPGLVFEYTWYYRLAGHFCPGFEKTLIIGGAAYSYPKYYLEAYPYAGIDVVEIDPGLTTLAKEHFGLRENPRMRIFHEDGRTFLNKSREKYDVILGDAYKSLLAIPFQLTTLEAVKLKYDMLHEEGVVIENLISSLEGPASQFMKAQYNTFTQVFPQVYLFACHDPGDEELLQSISLIAVKGERKAGFSNPDPFLDSLLQNRVSPNIPGNTIILTDDYAPVEFFAMKARR